MDRRKAKRIPILTSFSIALVIPSKGMHRIAIHDISNNGIGFVLNNDEELSIANPTQLGDVLEIHLYLNASLFLPLSIHIVRIENAQNGEQRIGAEFKNCDSKSYEAFLAFLTFLDKVQNQAILVSDPQTKS